MRGVKVSSGARSMIGIVFDATRGLADQPLTSVVSWDRIFDSANRGNEFQDEQYLGSHGLTYLNSADVHVTATPGKPVALDLRTPGRNAYLGIDVPNMQSVKWSVKRSTVGNRRSKRSKSISRTAQPVITTRRDGLTDFNRASSPCRPTTFASAASRMAHVLITMRSAASIAGASAQPAARSRPAISSESLRFIWQPRVQT